MAPLEILKDPLSSELQVAVFESQSLRRIHHAIHLKRGRLRLIQKLELVDFQFNGAILLPLV